MCSVMPACWAKAWKNSRNSSVSMSPSLGRENCTCHTKCGRPDTSMATRVSVSSMGR